MRRLTEILRHHAQQDAVHLSQCQMGSARVEGMLWTAHGFFRLLYDVQFRVKIDFYDSTGVAMLVPENQGTTCCLPRKLTSRAHAKKVDPVG